MTSTLDRVPTDAPHHEARTSSDATPRRRVSAWRSRLGDALWLLPPLLIGLIVNAINLGGSPQRIDDEGTYAAQAWSIANLGELTHYTYWYDHPPLGWIQIAAWAGLTDAWDRSVGSIAWAADGKSLYVTAQDTLEHPVFRVDAATGKVEKLKASPDAFALPPPAQDPILRPTPPPRDTA